MIDLPTVSALSTLFKTAAADTAAPSRPAAPPPQAAGLRVVEDTVTLSEEARRRLALLQSPNGERIQGWGDILNDTSGAASDIDKAKAYKQLVSAWQDGNPNFTVDEKRAASGIANSSDFMTKVTGLNDRIGQIVSGGGNANSLIAWYDTEATDWEKRCSPASAKNGPRSTPSSRASRPA